MVSPSVLAVFRLTTNSNLAGCSTCKSDGFRTYPRHRTKGRRVPVPMTKYIDRIDAIAPRGSGAYQQASNPPKVEQDTSVGLTAIAGYPFSELRMEAALKLLNRNSLGTSRAYVEAPIGSTNVGLTPV